MEVFYVSLTVYLAAYNSADKRAIDLGASSVRFRRFVNPQTRAIAHQQIMLDPASAISFAASVLQLVNFTKSVLTKSHELYRSVDGALVENADIINVSLSFQRLLSDIGSKAKPVANLGNKADKFEVQLQELYRGASKTVAPLIGAVERLKLQPKSCVWDSMLMAIKTVMKADEIEELEGRLDRYRKQIDTTLLHSLRPWIQHIQESQRVGFSEMQDALSILMNASKDHAEVLEQLRNSLSCNSEFTARGLPSELSTQILSTVVKRDQEDMARQHLLESMKYKDMPNRHEAIPSAYQETFEWIFNEPASHGFTPSTQDSNEAWPTLYANNFPEWLRGDQQLYWITGKPGSGKSTLMKYLYHDKRTKDNLMLWASRKWVDPRDIAEKGPGRQSACVHIAAFFCWNSGTQMQMSKLGLLRTLLCDLLMENQDLIATLFPERLLRCKFFGGDSRPFEWRELIEATRRLLSMRDRYFFLFIDGLDEFDGNTSEVADLSLELSRNPNVKVCASSRPWMDFEDAFDGNPMLRVEDLTRGDILTYVTGKLGTSKRFALLRDFKPQDADMLIREVADKACGVFLWVFLAIRSLLEGLRDGDDIDALAGRLKDLPEELEDLFGRILHQLDPSYVKEASEMFQFVQEQPGDASLLGVFLSHRTLDQAIAAECALMPQGEIDFCEDSMRRRVYSRCKCLLEVEPKKDKRWSKINYLHRAVREYLVQPRIRDQIRSNSDEYDSHAALGISLLLQAKHLTDVTKSSSPDAGYNLDECARNQLVRSIANIAAAPTVGAAKKIAFIDDIEKTGRALLALQAPHSIRTTDEGVIWMEKLDAGEPLPAHCGLFQLKPQSALGYAFAANLDWYVIERLERDPKLVTAIISNQYPLLFTAKSNYWRLSNYLLDHGADPNVRLGNQSPWTALLNTTYARLHSDIDEQQCYLQILTKFLERGADMSALNLGTPAANTVRKAIAKGKGDDRLACEIEALKAALDYALGIAAAKVQTTADSRKEPLAKEKNRRHRFFKYLTK